uniref:hypothetical protein n=1 Tax=Tepidiforma sp. TaxID=2682230 RepID=UPI002ADD5C4A
RTLSETDLRALGFRAPQPPAGYTIAPNRMTSIDIPAGCPRPEGFFASYSLYWTLENGTDSIWVHINSTPGATAGQGFSGQFSGGMLSWTTDDGTTYSISGSSKNIVPTAPLADYVAIAKSLDPEFDITKIIEVKSDGGPGGAVPPRPVPPEPAN